MAPTPALLLDPDALEANLARMAERCRVAGVALRPHVKGHRCAEIARRQVALGAVGVACATLREAEAMVDGGVADVLLTSALPPARAGDAVALALRAGGGAFAVVVAAEELVAALDREARAAGVVLPVLLDVEVGQRRGGVAPGAAMLALAERVAAARGLELVGVQGYEGHLQGLADPAERASGSAAAMAALTCAVEGLRAAGHAVPWVTTAGTGTAELAAAATVVTEVQPGSYAVMDASYARIADYAQAVWVEASVIAVLGPEEVIVDAGLKALSVDSGPAAVADLGASYAPAGDEHGRLTGALDLAVGDRVRLVPSHADTTVLLHDAFVLPDGTRLPVVR